MALKQTKGYSNFKGVISGLHNRKKGSARQDFAWGSKLTFFIKTSEFNSVAISLIAFNSRIGKDVYISTKTEDGSYETKAIDWSNRNDDHEDWNLIGINIKGKGEDEVVSLVEIDAIDYILDNFNDGDGVFINCDLKRSSYGEKAYINYEMKKTYALTEALDFTAEDFVEVSEFKEEFVFNEIFADKKSGKAFVKGNTISYGDVVNDAMFVINVATEEGEAIAGYIAKQVAFGDVLTVEGIVHNRVVGEWVDNEESKPLVGKSSKSFGKPARTFITKGEQKELEIVSVESLAKGLYTKAELEGEAEEDNSATPAWLK